MTAGVGGGWAGNEPILCLTHTHSRARACARVHTVWACMCVLLEETNVNTHSRSPVPHTMTVFFNNDSADGAASAAWLHFAAIACSPTYTFKNSSNHSSVHLIHSCVCVRCYIALKYRKWLQLFSEIIFTFNGFRFFLNSHDFLWTIKGGVGVRIQHILRLRSEWSGATC